MEEYKTKEAIMQLVPHSGKMSLLDRIVEYSFQDLTIVTEVDATPTSMFYDTNIEGIPVWIGFEYMAQSISALSGLYGKTKNEEPKLGFIMSVNSYKAEIPFFPKNSVVQMHVHQTMRMDKAVTFDGFITLGGETVATATLNTVEVDDPKKMLGL